MVKTRWWSLFAFLDSFIININTTRRYMRDCPKHPNVPPELYNLTDLLIGDLECAHEVAQGIMKAQLNIEGQKYFTSSMAIPIIYKNFARVCALEQIEFQAKPLNYFLGSNKSNINQYPHALLLTLPVASRFCRTAWTTRQVFWRRYSH